MRDGSGSSPNWMSKIVKESGIGLVGSVLGTVLNYAVLVTVTRFLDPEQFGTFALAQSVIAISLVFVLCGTPRALDRFIPQYNARNEHGRTKGLLESILRLSLWLGVAVAIGLLALSGPLASSVFANPGLQPVLRLMVISIPALAWIELVASSFVGFKELRYRVYTHQLALPVLKITFALSIFSLGYGLTGWIWAYLASLLVTSMLAWSFFRRRIWIPLRRTPAVAVDLREVVSYSWPLSVNNLVFMLSGHVGVLLLGAFRSEAEVGVFRVYVYIAAILVLVRTSFVRIYKPVAAEFASVRDPAGVRELFHRVSKWMLLAGSFVGLIILLMGKDILGILVPSSYRIATSALLLLAGARTVTAALGPHDMTLEAFGNTRLSMLNALLMLGVNVVLGRLLIPTHGVLGAAIALAAAVLVVASAGLLEVYVLHRLHPFRATYLRSLVVVLVAGALTYVLGRIWNIEGVPRIVSLTVVLALLYIGGLRFSGALDREDCAVLRRVWIRVTGR